MSDQVENSEDLFPRVESRIIVIIGPDLLIPRANTRNRISTKEVFFSAIKSNNRFALSNTVLQSDYYLVLQISYTLIYDYSVAQEWSNYCIVLAAWYWILGSY